MIIFSPAALDSSLLESGQLKEIRNFDIEQQGHYYKFTTKEADRRWNTIWSNRPLLAASWIALLILEGTYLDLARNRLSKSLWPISHIVSSLDHMPGLANQHVGKLPEMRCTHIAASVCTVSLIAYVCLLALLFRRYFRQAMVATIFLSTIVGSACGAWLGANPEEILLFFIPFSSNLAMSFLVLVAFQRSDIGGAGFILQKSRTYKIHVMLG